MHRAECTWPAAPQSVRAARAFVEEQLGEWGADAHLWPALTIVSELATNAVLHARTEFTVRLELDGAQLRIAVADGSPTLPERRHYDVQAATGRGIGLLEALTSTWGVDAHAGGKEIWAVVDPETQDSGTALSEQIDAQAAIFEFGHVDPLDGDDSYSALALALLAA